MLKPVCCYPSPSYFSLRSKSASLRSPNGFPSFPRSGDFPKAGGFIAYGPNLGDIRRRCGDCVAKILHGAKPSDLPIQRPERLGPGAEAAIAASVMSVNWLTLTFRGAHRRTALGLHLVNPAEKLAPQNVEAAALHAASSAQDPFLVPKKQLIEILDVVIVDATRTWLATQGDRYRSIARLMPSVRRQCR
jgi:hypothetical protein